MDSFANLLVGVAIITTIGAVVVIFARAIYRRVFFKRLFESGTWRYWMAFVLFVMTCFGYSASVQEIINRNGCGFFCSYIYTFPMLAAYTILVPVMYSLAPHLRPRWAWTHVVSLLTILASLLISYWLSIHPTRLSEFPKHSFTSIVFHVTLVIIIARICLPTFWYAHQREHHRPNRLRFHMMWLMTLAFAIWNLSEDIESITLLWGYTFNYKPLYAVLLSFCTLTFSMSFTTPYLFVVLTLIENHLIWQRDFFFIHVLDIVANRTARRKRTTYVRRRFPFLAPVDATHEAIISVFEAHKALKAQPDESAQWLSECLDRLAKGVPYTQLVDSLSALGKEATKSMIAQRVSLTRWK